MDGLAPLGQRPLDPVREGFGLGGGDLGVGVEKGGLGGRPLGPDGQDHAGRRGGRGDQRVEPVVLAQKRFAT